MDHCTTEIPQPANRFKMADRVIKLQDTQLPLDGAQNCSVLVLPFLHFTKLSYFLPIQKCYLYPNILEEIIMEERKSQSLVYCLTWFS